MGKQKKIKKGAFLLYEALGVAELELAPEGYDYNINDLIENLMGLGYNVEVFDPFAVGCYYTYQDMAIFNGEGKKVAIFWEK